MVSTAVALQDLPAADAKLGVRYFLLICITFSPKHKMLILVISFASYQWPISYSRKYHIASTLSNLHHLWRPRGSQACSSSRHDESFQACAEQPLRSVSHQSISISKRPSKCWLLIGHNKWFVSFCPVGEQRLLGSFRLFAHNGYCLAKVVRTRETFILYFPNQKPRNYR